MAAGEPSSISGSKLSAGEKLLGSANELFYAEGVQSVGIDRIIEHAGVAKASLYNTFGSKEELVRAYLEVRREGVSRRIRRQLERCTSPRERVLAVYDAQQEMFDQPGFRGCAFVSATAEARPGSMAEQAAADYRRWLRSLLSELAIDAGVGNPQLLSQQLQLLFDGASMSARMDHDRSAAQAARSAAAALLDAAIASAVVAPAVSAPAVSADTAS